MPKIAMRASLSVALNATWCCCARMPRPYTEHCRTLWSLSLQPASSCGTASLMYFADPAHHHFIQSLCREPCLGKHSATTHCELNEYCYPHLMIFISFALYRRSCAATPSTHAARQLADHAQ